MKKLLVLCILLTVALAFADTPPPIGIQTLFKSAPKPNPAGAMPRLVGMQGSTLVQLPLSSAKPALATTSSAGIVKIGTGLSVAPDGTLNNTGIAGVASFNGRGGAVTPTVGDYSIGQISGAATVAATGSYTDLTSKPTIPAAQVNSDWTALTGVAQILNKPTVPTALSQLSQDATHRTVTDAEKTAWNTVTASVNSVNGQTGTVTLTATDVGADPLGSATSVQTNLSAHTGATNNPHSVTKAQVGLGSADNTSDAAKPISTATQAALDLKANANALPANTSAVSHYFLTGYNSSTKAFLMAQPQFGDLTALPTTLYGYGITDALSVTGNAASATKLQTARTINGVAFDGTANITVADSTKEAALGNPGANGYVLSSTTGGTRSWVAQSGGIADAASDGGTYGRKNAAWVAVPTVDNPTFTTGITAPVFASNAADGGHYVQPYNSTAYSGTCSKGMVQTVGTPAALQVCTADGTWAAVTGAVASVNGNTGTITTSQLGAYYPGGTDVPIADGGTGASTAAGALANLGAIGGTVGATADRIPLSSGTGGATLKASSIAVDPTTSMVSVPTQSNVVDAVTMEDGAGKGAGFVLTGALSGNYHLGIPAAAPSAGLIMVTGTPVAGQNVHGLTSTVIPVTFAANTNTSGFYAPTFTAVSNASSITGTSAHYLRIGNEVQVSGSVSFSNSTNASSQIDANFPIASNVSGLDDCGGVVTSYVTGTGGKAICETTNKRISFYLYNASTSGAVSFSYSYTYTVK